MNEYKPPCGTEQCGWPSLGGESLHLAQVNACHALALRIVKAEVTGLLEVSPCPIEAALTLDSQPLDTPEQIAAKQSVLERLEFTIS